MNLRISRKLDPADNQAGHNRDRKCKLDEHTAARILAQAPRPRDQRAPQIYEPHDRPPA